MTRTLRSTRLWTAFVLVAGCLGVFAAPAAQAWAPGNNGLIAYDQIPIVPFFPGPGQTLPHPACSICIVDPQGLAPEHDIPASDVASEPAWSPDGRHLAFIVPVPGFSNLNTVQVSNPDGTHRITVASNIDQAPDIHSPVWSPDGRSIAYVAQLSTGSAIWVVHSFGGAWGRPIRIWPAPGDTISTEDIGRIAWSPDGSQLAFAANPAATFLGAQTTGNYGVFGTSATGANSSAWYEIDDEHIGGFGVNFVSNQLDWGPGGVDYLIHPNELAVEAPGAPHQSFSVNNLLGFAVAPFQESSTAIPYQYVGSFASDGNVYIFTRTGAHAPVTTNLLPGTTVTDDNVAWQPLPNCPPGTHTIGSVNGISFCTRVGVRVPQTVRYASYASTRLAAIIACAQASGCLVDGSASSGGQLLGEGSTQLRDGQLKQMVISFSVKGRALLRSGAVHRVSLLFRLRHSGKVVARRSVPVGRPSSVTLACPAASSEGSTTSIGGSFERPRGLLFSPTATGGSHALLFMAARSDRGMHEMVRLHTNGEGRYSGKLKIGTQGTWIVEVVYPGSRSIVPAVAHCEINVPPPSVPVPTSLKLACPSGATAGSPVSISGTLGPAIKGVPVRITYTESGGTTIVDTVTTNGFGQFTDSRTFGSAGQVQVQAAITGSQQYKASTSSPCAFSVSPAGSSVTLACPTSATVNGAIGVSGTLSPAEAGATIRITYTPPTGSPITDTAVTDASGNYTDSITATQKGTWTIQASFPGDSQHAPASSSPCGTQVSGIATTLTLSCPAKVSVKEAIAVSGVLSPGFAGASIQITYTPPSGPAVVDMTTTDSSGNYSDSMTATQTGTWTIQPSFAGDSQHQGSTSSACTTSVG